MWPSIVALSVMVPSSTSCPPSSCTANRPWSHTSRQSRGACSAVVATARSSASGSVIRSRESRSPRMNRSLNCRSFSIAASCTACTSCSFVAMMRSRIGSRPSSSSSTASRRTDGSGMPRCSSRRSRPRRRESRAVGRSAAPTLPVSSSLVRRSSSMRRRRCGGSSISRWLARPRAPARRGNPASRPCGPLVPSDAPGVPPSVG